MPRLCKHCFASCNFRTISSFSNKSWPTVVSMYNYVQPVVAVLFTVAIGLDTFGFTKAGAALCVFAGVWLVNKSKSRAQLDADRLKGGN